MPFQLAHDIASWFLKKRIHQIELFTKYPHDVQYEVLGNLIKTAKDTEVGKRYGFSEISDYKTFASRVPIQRYEDMADDIDRSRKGENNIFWPTPIQWFAMSSGTTNARSKYIPVSVESLEECHYAGGKDLLCMYLHNNPESSLLVGKGLRLGGSKQIQSDGGTAYGDLSSIMIDNMPFWADYSSTPDNKTALMSDWEKKLPAIVEQSIDENVTSLAGVPSWMMVLLNQVLETTGKSSILDIWPNLEVYFHGGVSFSPYTEQYKKVIPSSSMKYYEIYNASEGFFALQDINDTKELLLMLDYGIFYEFIPMDAYGTVDQKIVPINEVEIGKNYAVVITTNGGLWRYKIGDTVRFTNISPYRVKVSGRTKHHINVFGEELIIENAEEALKRTVEECPCEIADYTVAPIFMQGREKGAHEWMISFKNKPSDGLRFRKSLDKNLRAVNSDYDAKRNNDTTLNAPTIHLAEESLFYDWMKSKSKLGGQHKVPRLSNTREHLEEILGFYNKNA